MTASAFCRREGICTASFYRWHRLLSEAGAGDRLTPLANHSVASSIWAPCLRRVHLYGHPADIRKSFDGLYAITRRELEQDPLSGKLFVFINRRTTQMKVRYRDRSGFCVWAKRLAQGRFLSDWRRVASREMDRTELKLLLEGIEARRVRKRYRHPGESMPSVNSRISSKSYMHILNAEEAAALAPAEVAEWVGNLQQQVSSLQSQLDGFKRQIFGQKSEKRFVAGEDGQMGRWAWAKCSPVCRNTTRRPRRTFPPTRTPTKKTETGEALPFFDENRVPVEIIELAAPETQGLGADEFELIGHKESYRLAQRPGIYVVLKYRRPVAKVKGTEAIHCPPAPESVIRNSRADVSFVVGMRVDKFCDHPPLYRQHQRLGDNGIDVSRPWLHATDPLGHRAARAHLHRPTRLNPDPSRQSHGRDPDQGRACGSGKMKGGYFWPVYGERDEICFVFHESRKAQHIAQTLGIDPPEGAVLIADGLEAYARYAEKCGLTHAQCWTHTRRKFFDARAIEPEGAEPTLEMIGRFYSVEKHIREAKLAGEALRAYRRAQAKPVVVEFFTWIDKHFENQGWLPSSPRTKAMAYARERRAGLEVYLDDAEVAIDTNHLERALKVVSMGRKNGLFCSTEVGAKYVGVIQSLISTCRLHRIDPYEYLINVLQRVAQHPASQVVELTPRILEAAIRRLPPAIRYLKARAVARALLGYRLPRSSSGFGPSKQK